MAAGNPCKSRAPLYILCVTRNRVTHRCRSNHISRPFLNIMTKQKILGSSTYINAAIHNKSIEICRSLLRNSQYVWIQEQIWWCITPHYHTASCKPKSLYKNPGKFSGVLKYHINCQKIVWDPTAQYWNSNGTIDPLPCLNQNFTFHKDLCITWYVWHLIFQ